MPFIPHTPESLLQRSDSKNPAATCHGLTSVGRPCRRAINVIFGGASRPDSPNAYCWQHKDQAAAAASTQISPRSFQSDETAARARTSVDTLIDRLGLLEIVQEKDERRNRDRRRGIGKSSQSNIKDTVQSLKGQPSRARGNTGPKRKQQSNLTLFCCVGTADDEQLAPRPARPKTMQTTSQRRATQPMRELNRPSIDLHSRSDLPPSTRPLPKPHQRQSLSTPTTNRPLLAPSSRSSPFPLTKKAASSSPTSQTAEFLSLIPHTVSPQTSALLLAELAKPTSVFDEEGYIYIFWLTPENLPTTPAKEAAASLLETPPSNRPRQRPALEGNRRRRTSEVLESFSNRETEKKTIILKIGRANNVQRRLNEWSRQCGYQLSLVRYYPYFCSSISPSPLPSPPSSEAVTEGAPPPLKVPNAHKIERLIHIELAHLRPDRDERNSKCARCGANHREWFEVEASREGVRTVDEVVRRWVGWGMGAGTSL